MIQCFLIEPNGIKEIKATNSWEGCQKSGYDYHRSSTLLFTGPEEKAQKYWNTAHSPLPVQAICQYCGADGGERIPDRGMSSQYVRKDTGEVKSSIAEFGVGAMWFADWYKNQEFEEGCSLYSWEWANQDTPPLYVKTPGGDWCIDSRCSNCALPNDRLHRCWVRHGTPPVITVDKNGHTCAAGGGSIQQKTWHGFLRNGYLVEA